MSQPMASAVPQTSPSLLRTRRLLVVDSDDQQRLRLEQLCRQALPGGWKCQITSVDNLAAARKLLGSRRLRREPIDLVILDAKLPDGEGLSLLPELAEANPDTRVLATASRLTVQWTLDAFRRGVLDVVPKPVDDAQLADRLCTALERQHLLSKTHKRLTRLHSAVRKLNQARRVVSKKVDLLCNDLVVAYGELAKQMEDVRTVESFRKTLDDAVDLEQMLCHAMDWILRRLGHVNIGLFLADEDGTYELGAYMKYTLSGENGVTHWLRDHVVVKAAGDGFLHVEGNELVRLFGQPEGAAAPLAGMTVAAADCSYLSESLASIVVFRDERCPLKEEDKAALRAIAPIFAQSLTSLVRRHAEQQDGQSFDKPMDDQEDDGWWRRGEAPPF